MSRSVGGCDGCTLVKAWSTARRTLRAFRETFTIHRGISRRATSGRARQSLTASCRQRVAVFQLSLHGTSFEITFVIFRKIIINIVIIHSDDCYDIVSIVVIFAKKFATDVRVCDRASGIPMTGNPLDTAATDSGYAASGADICARRGLR